MDIDSDDDYRESNSEKEIARSPIYSPRGASPIRGSIPVRRKRRIESSITPKGSPPLKRMKGNFNAAYLDLLNRDINDAASGLIHGEAEEEEKEEDADQQIGAVMWSAAEKAAFFAAVSRLGRADFTGISARIGTKSELEVHQYLVLLDATEGEGVRQNALRPVDIPAAVEIGAECAAALEAAADALSLCQESYEEQVEKKRWGSRWRVTAQLVETIKSQQRRDSEASMPHPRPRERMQKEHQRREEEEDDRKEQLQMEKEEQENKGKRLDESPFFQFFRVQNWLLLSNRVFMNSAIPDGNWRAASEEHEPPAIQMTVLSDLYALAVSVTRRLLVSALYVAESRIRRNSFEVVQRQRKTWISVEDVIAAVSSLGMKQNSNEFWARCARRLQLDVVNDMTGEDKVTDEEDEGLHTHSEQGMDSDDQLLRTVESEPESTEESGDSIEEDEDDYGEIMSYDEIEAVLGYPVVDSMHSRHSTPEPSTSTTTDILSNSQDEADEGEQEEYPEEEEDDEEHDGDIKMKDQQETSGDDLHLDTMALDIEEAMISLESTERTVDGTDATRAIESRIRAEHKLEGGAELLDMQASMKAERKLWAILRDHDNTKTGNQKR
ncbi:hypothetical protein FHL15_000968 [Xylaria flabelliformis]|uniref:Myb-like domain-containing protein n=1 Tax=Xylaria flabelliformis TaxID=2512241 RepID=A0A553IDQ6_9PEZI|nr:hypothetical protein FHL15_000968 [Xylaria flabelliformis]